MKRIFLATLLAVSIGISTQATALPEVPGIPTVVKLVNKNLSRTSQTGLAIVGAAALTWIGFEVADTVITTAKKVHNYCCRKPWALPCTAAGLVGTYIFLKGL